MFVFWIICCFLSLAQSTICYKVELVPSPKTVGGEVPHWDAKTQSLYYLDIDDANSSILRYDYAENRVYRATVEGAPILLFILPIKCSNDQFLVGINRQAVIIQWDGRSPKATPIGTLFEVDTGTSNRFNDCKTDAHGRFYGGTKSVDTCDGTTPTGSFYKFEKRNGLKNLFGNISISNGFTWARKTNKFYYIDSCAYDIKEFDYDPKTGDLSNGQGIYSLIRDGTKPDYVYDGMTSDRDGNLYIAKYGGSSIVKFDPKTRKILMEIKLPATQVSALAFGGPKLSILYVTTANSDGMQVGAGSGYLFKITGLCAKGYAGVRLNVFPACKKGKKLKCKKC